MPLEAIVGLVLTVLTLFCGIVGHICFSVWWASKITTTLGFLKVSLDKMEEQNKDYVKKEDFIHRCADLDLQMAATWKRIDDIRNRVEIVEKELVFLKANGK